MRSIRHFTLAVGFVIVGAAGLGAVTDASAATARSRHSVVVRSRPHSHSRVFIYRGSPFYYGYGYPGYYYGAYGPGPYGYPYPAPRPNYAIIDTDISPEEASVYVDGERVGEADDFDGFPEYLTLSPGRHVVEFRKSGYQPLRIDINARRGGFYDIDRDLRAGNSRSASREDWGGGPPRRRHDLQSTPPPIDRYDDRDLDDEDRQYAPDDDPGDQLEPEDEDPGIGPDEGDDSGDNPEDEDGSDEPEEPEDE